MTIAATRASAAPASPAKPRSNRMTFVLGGGVVAAIVAAWVAVGLAKWAFDAPDGVLVALVVAAIVLTEAALWVGGAVLGISALAKARGWLRLRFGRG